MGVKRYIVCIAFLVAMVLSVSCLLGVPSLRTSESTNGLLPILIDAGHGGEDGGAVATDGTMEKHVNLQIALMVRDVLRIMGYPVNMTRETDISIHDASCHTIREKKVSDMHNRLTLYQQASLVIAIHQNHYSSSQYSGAQVFYSGNHPASLELASGVDEALSAGQLFEKRREIKKASDGLFLMHHASRPAILVECGFLSNPVELTKLKTASYQQQLALCIAAGALLSGVT